MKKKILSTVIVLIVITCFNSAKAYDPYCYDWTRGHTCSINSWDFTPIIDVPAWYLEPGTYNYKLNATAYTWGSAESAFNGPEGSNYVYVTSGASDNKSGSFTVTYGAWYDVYLNVYNGYSYINLSW